ncbi:UNKNOWN [Stylonychia lemnae]|uniref:Uncharacterized protein n=1 Tax=Stylonychia lemnae TaxID=5949 RepID=A0A078AY27_STYLE|nr:UNKNOWN [Stylonychia lemnae]|eukprot:CDW87069.1 UNKNOWN [Stylonychia lemnae]
MNSTSKTFQSQTTKASHRKETLGGSFNDENFSVSSGQSERQKYIADCKRLLSGLKKCQQQNDGKQYEKQGAAVQDENEQSQQFKFESYRPKDDRQNQGLEALEKMLDDYDVLYDSSKEQLYDNLRSTHHFTERKRILDDYFANLENDSNQIKNSQVYRAFKNLHLTGNSIQKLREGQEQAQIKVLKKKLTFSDENEKATSNQDYSQEKQSQHLSNQNYQQSNLFRDIQNSHDLSPEKRQPRDPQLAQQEQMMKHKKSMGNGSSGLKYSNQENASPVKRSSGTENQENQIKLGSMAAGKENSSQRRRKSERNKEGLRQQQSKTENSINQTQQQQLQQVQQNLPTPIQQQQPLVQQSLPQISQEALKERQALKDTLNKSLFKSQKFHRQQTLTQQQQEQIPQDITKVISVDSYVINYGKFVCGKILGSTLQVSNTSNSDQIIEITVDNQQEDYSCDDIFGPYQRNELPFQYKDGTSISNSEVSLSSWFIENPINKDLVKSLTIRISPNCEKEFIIVLKAPNNKVKYNLASFIVIKQAQNLRRTSSISLQNENFEVEKRLRKNGSDLSDISIEIHKNPTEQVQKEIKVMLLGKLENPTIECLRQLYHQEAGCEMIPLGVKKTQAQQKFRIPFKNLSLNQDAEVEFTFVRLPKSHANSQDGNSDASQQDDIDLSQYLEFYCQPSNLKLPMNSQGFLNVLIKVNSLRLNNEVSTEQLLRKPINKLLIAKLKDTNVLFHYFISISMINQ